MICLASTCLGNLCRVALFVFALWEGKQFPTACQHPTVQTGIEQSNINIIIVCTQSYLTSVYDRIQLKL